MPRSKQFAHDHTEPETDLYVRLREETYRVMQWPQMQVDVIEWRFLQMLVRLSGAKAFSSLECSPATAADDGRSFA